MIADEIQSGLARSGRMLASDWEEVRPDMVVRSCFRFMLLMSSPSVTHEHKASILFHSCQETSSGPLIYKLEFSSSVIFKLN